MKEDVILVGGFPEIIETCEEAGKRIIGIIDNRRQGRMGRHRIIGHDGEAAVLAKKYNNVPLIIVPDNPSARKKLVTLYTRYGFSFCSLVSPSAKVSPSARLGRGIILKQGVIVSSGAIVGDFVHANTGAIVMHDCQIGAYSTLAPAAVLLGGAVTGKNCYIGANATVFPGVTFGDNAVAGAGAVVLKDVAGKTVVAGNPAREIKRS